MFFDFKCPHCSHVIEMENDWIGLEGECPFCGGVIIIEKQRTNIVEKRWSSNYTPETFFNAIDDENIELIGKIIKQNPELLNFRNAEEISPLNCALLKNNTEIAKMLILNGSDINSASTKCASPMFLSAHFGNIKIAQLLLVRGADVNLHSGIENNTPLHAGAEIRAMNIS